MPKSNCGEAVVKVLEKEGIDTIFCVPGESYLPVLDALFEHHGIRVVTCRHESGAAFMAEGYAKIKGKPAVVMATRGVGAANLSIGVHTARQDSTPMIVLLGQVDSNFRGREGFQEVDFDHYFGRVAKWTTEITHPTRTVELMQKACMTAKSGRPGPVVVALPEDVLRTEIPLPEIRPRHYYKPGLSEGALEVLEEEIIKCKRPCIVAGGGVKASGGEAALSALAERAGIPVMAAFRRHDVFNHTHSLFAGHLGLGTPDELLKTVREADLVLAVGTRLSEVTTQDYSLIQGGQTLIQIDIDPADPGLRPAKTIQAAADAKTSMEAIARRLEMRGFSPHWKEWAEMANRAYLKSLEIPNRPEGLAGCDMDHVFSQIIRLWPDDGIVTNDAGNFAGWLHKFFPFKIPNSYSGPTSGAMGYGFPAALGASIAAGGRPVYSFSGDGGFMMTMQECETAVRENIPVCAFVFNNASYGTIRMHQEKHFPGRVVATDLSDVNFGAMAALAGMESYVCKTNEDFDQIIEPLMTRSLVSPVLVEVKTDIRQIAVGRDLDE